MDNFKSLAWASSLSGIALGVICLLLFAIYYFKKMPIEKGGIFIGILAIVYFGYVGLPYISDCVIQEEKYIYGTVLKETKIGLIKRNEAYSYTLQAENGDQVTAQVAEKYYDTLGMEVGKEYYVSYFAHSKAVIEVEKLMHSFYNKR